MTKVLNLKGNKTRKDVTLPEVFTTAYRPDIIKRAVLSEQSKQKQPQGRFPLAGRLTTASSMGPGRGTSKVPRTHGKGSHHSGRGALIHSTVGGRMLFPPSTEKIIVEKINKKEHKLALRSAIAATAQKELVESRGHLVSEKLEFPLIIEDSLTEVSKTSQLKETLESIGLGEDVKRCSKRSIRAGKGKRRGRKYRTKTGPLIVTSDDSDVASAGSNLLGVEVVRLSNLSVEQLAPGGDAARLTLWTESAIKLLETEV